MYIGASHNRIIHIHTHTHNPHLTTHTHTHTHHSIGVTVEFEETSYSINEGEGAVVFQINATFQAAFTGPELVRISGFPAPHEPSMDFNITESGIQTLSYPVVNDDLLDEDQMFNVTLESPDFMVMIGSSNTASVSIDEDDSKTNSVPHYSWKFWWEIHKFGGLAQSCHCKH